METSVRMVARVRILAATSGVSALAVTMATPAATVSYLFDDCNICRLQKITYPFKKKKEFEYNTCTYVSFDLFYTCTCAHLIQIFKEEREMFSFTFTLPRHAEQNEDQNSTEYRSPCFLFSIS